ncbi:Uncharacterized membrane protein [Eubacterium aggregans]|uniref:Uncharacterized membrane protein n=1 Tax=Eubacterium aggregans TaxID=81409 RepID=A0A1H4BQR1_9FIRM|nr:DUF1622 domain-containing protein [Eubacterium aggregans]SEA50515.1 Uncharacterized membrane protein [Eubacterium aggregans]
MEILQTILDTAVEYGIYFFECVGVIVLIIAGIQGVIGYVKKCPYVRLNLAKGMAMALEFKLGAEILRTVVVREWPELIIVGGIILLRAALTFLIHWEIKNEEEEKTPNPSGKE